METSSLLDDLRKLHLSEKSAVQMQKTEQDYVLDLSVQTGKADPLVAAVCSNFTIRLLSRNRLTPVSTISGHTDTITKVQFGKTDTNLIFSCSKDKTVKGWDIRSSPTKEVHKFEIPPTVKADMLSLDISQSDRLLCVGTEMIKNDAFLLFWDTRQNSILGSYSECHKDDVTQVCFQPGSDQYMASGSVDGLVCTFDLQETSEDDALQVTTNAESDVARIGWCGENCNESIYCVTSDNAFHVWDALEGDTLCCIANFEQLQKNQTAEYLLDCIPEYTANGHKSSSVLLLGTHSGCLSLVSCTDDGVNTLSSLSGAHTATIRCCQWDSETKTLLTGGEDSLLCLWSTETSSQLSNQNTKGKAKAQGKIKGKASVPDSGKKPYDMKKR